MRPRDMGSVAFPLAILYSILVPPALYAQSVITVTVDRSTPDGTSNFSIGVTHTQPKSEEGDPAAVARAKS